jgi:hypothetical protein
MEAYKLSDGRSVKLGKKPAKIDARTLQFDVYLAPDINPTPLAVNWYKGVTSFGMMANDTLGDCTIASKGHDLQVASLNSKGEITLTEAQAIQYYSLWDGYVPGDPSTDQGGVIIDVLNDWRQQKLINHSLLGYSALTPTNQESVCKAVELFGVVDVGLQLPLSAQAQTGGVWDVASGPNGEAGSWGGHNVTMGAYNETGPIFITWGALQQATWAFLSSYSDELYALLIGEWMGGGPVGSDAPSGFNLAQLMQDLTAVTG